jgi:hypothetical protein
VSIRCLGDIRRDADEHQRWLVKAGGVGEEEVFKTIGRDLSL